MIEAQDLESAVGAMTDKGMEELLVELGNSTFFPAIVRYARQRSEQVMLGMWTIDPVKEPALLARYQGVKAGIDDLEGFIRAAEEMRKQKEKEENEKTNSN